MKKGNILICLLILIMCSGCTPSLKSSFEKLEEFLLNPSFEGDVCLVKDDVMITKTDYIKYGPDEIEYQNYELKIPYKVEGEITEDIKDIPVRYDLGMESDETITELAVHTEMDTATITMESSFDLLSGSKDGYIVLKMDYSTRSCMLGEPEIYPYIWVAIQLDDADNTNDAFLLHNPYYKGDYEHSDISDFEVLETDIDFDMKEDLITLEKGRMEDDIQHYVLTIPVEADSLEGIDGNTLEVGADFFCSAVNGDGDVTDGFDGSNWFQEGISLGFRETVHLDESCGLYNVTMDVYNLFAGGPTGNDIDFYPYFWVAIGARDSNMNNNYYILKNPFFNDDNPYCLDEIKISQAYFTRFNERLENMEGE